jgi:predicted nucleic acid-binding protein
VRRALLDINVVMDVLLDRRPHSEASGAAWAAVEAGLAEGLLAAHALPTIYYLYTKVADSQRARHTIAALLNIFQVAPLGAPALQEAVHLRCPDYEDAVTAVSARLAGCDCIVTRDARGFHASPVPPLTPEAFVAMVNTDTSTQTI